MEVVQHPVVPIEELLRLSSGVDELSLEVSEALGISLSKVHDWYFGGSDKVKRDHIMVEERDCYQDWQQFEEEHKKADEQEHCQELQSYQEDTTF
jgi:uncharacterized protein YdaT